jgi:hypothetical protein
MADPTIGALARVRTQKTNRGREAEDRVASIPAEAVRSVTPNDTTDLPDGDCRAIFVGTAGDLVCNDGTGTEFTVTAYAGMILPVVVSRVKATGTTAGNILAMY